MAFLFREGKLTKITQDDDELSTRKDLSEQQKSKIRQRLDSVRTMADYLKLTQEEQNLYKRRSVIANNLGLTEKKGIVVPHIYEQELFPGDILLVASDGIDNFSEKMLEEEINK